MTNWYQLPERDILNLVMIILRSSMKIRITAGKLITMSIYTFGSVRFIFLLVKEGSPIFQTIYHIVYNFR